MSDRRGTWDFQENRGRWGPQEMWVHQDLLVKEEIEEQQDQLDCQDCKEKGETGVQWVTREQVDLLGQTERGVTRVRMGDKERRGRGAAMVSLQYQVSVSIVFVSI